ncbi:hypothetical protein BH11PSE11_BH11PSE11_09260 [soil metagenome]
MSIAPSVKLAFLVICTSLCGITHSQSLYRCGSVYQDRPCEGGQQGKIIGSTGNTTHSAKPTADAECTQKGARTLKIVWSREAGAGAEKQMADIDARQSPNSAEEKKLVMEVFARRGSASEVRAAIEADCMQDKERAGQAAALINAAQALTGKPQPTVAPPPTVAPDTREAGAKAADARREEVAAREKSQKKSRCDDLKSRLVGIRNEQRTGGDVRTMERLNQNSRETENLLRETGC